MSAHTHDSGLTRPCTAAVVALLLVTSAAASLAQAPPPATAPALAAGASVAAPPGRYALLHDGADVLDTVTRLVRRRCSEGQTLTDGRCTGTPRQSWSHDELARAAPRRETAWRMPTEQELLTLVLRPLRFPDGRAVVDETHFPDTPRSNFHVKETGNNPSIMPFVNFATGEAGGRRPLVYHVRLVRDASPSGVAR
jgi:hypothetical protein